MSIYLRNRSNKAGVLHAEELDGLQKRQVQFGRREIEIGLLNQ
ncbi:hypothetical protein [Cardinium endosymbiont of Tipula unca]